MAQNGETYENIGDSSKILCLRNSGQIKLLYGDRYINLFDSEGNLNARIKDLIHVGAEPTNSSQDGFYFTPGSGNILPKFYVKKGNQILEVSNASSKTDLPEGSIIMYKGSLAPDGWLKFNAPTDISGTIYIINSTEQGAGDADLYDIWLDWLDSNNNRVVTATAKMGESFNLPLLRNLVNSLVSLQYEYSSSDIGVATIDNNGTVRLVSPGWTIIKAETQANGIHKYDYASYTLNVTSAEKAIVVISVSNLNVANTNATYTPVMGVTGASLSEVELQKTSDPNNIISSISGQMMSLTGNVGTAGLHASIPETSSHKSANSGFTLTVTGTLKRNVTITVYDLTITNDRDTYTLTISITGATLSELNIVKNEDSSNIISSISGTTLILNRGNTGTVSLTASIPETSEHYGKSQGFLLTVNSALSSFLTYKVGLISDIHYCITHNDRELISSEDGNDNPSGSYFDDDLEHILGVFNNQNVDLIASPGDIATLDINDFIKFTDDYNSNTNKPFYCAMGNHDHLVTYGSNSWTLTNEGTDGSRWTHVTGSNGSGQGSWDCPGSLCGNIPSALKSNMSYYITKGTKDIFVFLHAYYGSELNTSLKLTHPHNRLPEPSDASEASQEQKYVKLMVDYCGINSFTGNESYFNFRYYNTEDLIWLKNVIEANTSKRIFIFSHYFFPHKAGGGNKYVPGASTELMGITFHFLNKLNNTHKNTIWFSGHSHISWKDESLKGIHWTNKNYDYVTPTASDNSTILSNYTADFYRVTTGNNPYNRKAGALLSNVGTGWNVHLPSMSRPIESNSDQMSACEAAIMTISENEVKILKLGYTRDNNGSYSAYSSIPDNELTIDTTTGNGTCNDNGPELSNADYFEIRITNNLNVAALYSGKMEISILEISTGNYVWLPLFYSPPTGTYTDNGIVKLRWYTNVLKIEAGLSKTIRYTTFKDYTDDYGVYDYHEYPISLYANGTYRFDPSDNGPSDSSPNVKFATALTGETDNTTNNAFYIAPLSGTINKNTTYDLTISYLGDNYSGHTLAPYTGSESGGGDTPTPSANEASDRLCLYWKFSSNSAIGVNSKVRFELEDGGYLYCIKPNACEAFEDPTSLPVSFANAGEDYNNNINTIHWRNKYGTNPLNDPDGNSATSYAFSSVIWCYLASGSLARKYNYLFWYGVNDTTEIYTSNYNPIVGRTIGMQQVTDEHGTTSVVNIVSTLTSADKSLLTTMSRQAFNKVISHIKLEGSVRVYGYKTINNSLEEVYYDGEINRITYCNNEAEEKALITQDLNNLILRNGSSESGDDYGVLIHVNITNTTPQQE